MCAHLPCGAQWADMGMCHSFKLHLMTVSVELKQSILILSNIILVSPSSP